MNTAESRFWAKVNKEGAGSCWEWTACLFKASGYGCFSYERKLQGAHRVSWQLTHGPIPEGLWVLHRCDNRKCVRPDHLFLGTSLENNRDMYAKGRGRPPVGDVNWIRKSPGAQKGERNFNAHLDALAVLTIKSRLTEGERPGIIASSFGVSVPTIGLIANGTNWGHVPWPDGAAMSVDCALAVRSRALRARRLAATGGACAERCGRPADGARERCAACWLVRRRDSKRAHASKGRERKREAAHL